MAKVADHVVLVEHVEHAVGAGRDHEPAAIHGFAQLGLPGGELHGFAAQAECLPQGKPGAVERGPGAAGLLQLEVLRGAPKPFQVREHLFGDLLGREIQRPALPNPRAEEEGKRLREAVVGIGGERRVASVQVRVLRRESVLVEIDVRTLAVEIPLLIFGIVHTRLREGVHHAETLVVRLYRRCNGSGSLFRNR
jgi:hypothetical protein